MTLKPLCVDEKAAITINNRSNNNYSKEKKQQRQPKLAKAMINDLSPKVRSSSRFLHTDTHTHAHACMYAEQL